LSVVYVVVDGGTK